MHWIVQNNLWAEAAYDGFIEALHRLKVDYTRVQLLPFVDKIIPEDFDKNTTPIEDAPSAIIDESLALFPSGSTKLSRIAKQRGWKGAMMNDNMQFDKWKEGVGENLLNHGAITCTVEQVLEHVDNIPQELFTRPCHDNKAYSGRTHTKDNFIYWAKEISKVDPSEEDPQSTLLNRTTPIIFGQYHKILAEYRFMVVDGQVVTGSIYKLGSRVIYDSAYVNDDALAYAQRMVKQWQPARAFVIDVCETPKGYKVVEYNCINCSGFYACDYFKFIDAIENMRL